MKWALSQLHKYRNDSFSFDCEYDFHENINNIDDILDISPVKVSGVGKNIEGNRYVFQIHIECFLILECARTLDAINFPINLDIIEIFDDVDDGEVNLIEKNTICLDNVIWENIYLEKPMRVVKEDSGVYQENIETIQKFYEDETEEEKEKEEVTKNADLSAKKNIKNKKT